MKYTKDDLAKMSDFDVNKALAPFIYDDAKKHFNKIGNIHSVHQDGSSGAALFFGCHENGEAVSVGVFDFNSWSDIMPLAIEHKIGIAPNKDSWEAFTLEDNYQVVQNQFVDGSPQRAIACCLILVLQDRQ